MTKGQCQPPADAPSVSLFSNCGAGDVGYAGAGFRFRVLAELRTERLKIAVRNHADAVGIQGDLRDSWPEVVEAYHTQAGDEDPWLLSACPPCQGMSSVNADRGKHDDPKAGGRDPRNLLVTPIVKVAKALRPRMIVVENVPAFLTRQVPDPASDAGIPAAALLIRMLRDDYVAFPLLADLCDYGVPQNRRRAFVCFVRTGESGLEKLQARRRAPFPRPTHVPAEAGLPPRTVRQALQELDVDALDASSPGDAKGEGTDPLHSVPSWSAHHYAMVAAIPPHSGGSAWELEQCGRCGEVEVGDDDAVCPRCGQALLRPIVDDGDGQVRLVKGYRSTSYRRMDPDAPAPTVTTASGNIGSSRTIHPWENRVLSPRECAHLQTFPDDFDWGERPDTDPGLTRVRQMIGEAVPPRFTELHGHVLMGLLLDDQRGASISLFDSRCDMAREWLNMPRSPWEEPRPDG